MLIFFLSSFFEQQECAQHQKLLLDSVLSLQKIESQNFELGKSKFKLIDTLKSVTTMFKDMANEKGIEIDLEVNGDFIRDGGYFLGSGASELKQIIINFIS